MRLHCVRTMRFVAVKSEDQQARAMLFRTRQMFVGQRTQMINALRGHLAEHGLVAARGPAHLKTLADAIADTDTTLLTEVRELGRMYLEQIEGLNARVAELDAKMRCAAKKRTRSAAHRPCRASALLRLLRPQQWAVAQGSIATVHSGC